MKKIYLIAAVFISIILLYVSGLFYVRSYRESGWHITYHSSSQSTSVGQYVDINKAPLFGEQVYFWPELYGFLLGSGAEHKKITSTHTESIISYFHQLAIEQLENSVDVQYLREMGINTTLDTWSIELRYDQERDTYHYLIKYFFPDGSFATHQWEPTSSETKRESEIFKHIQGYLH